MQKKIIFYLCLYGLFFSPILNATHLVMLDPAGHGQDAGRRLWSGYERAETLAFCKRLGLQLQSLGVDVEFTRKAGDSIVPLQTASFSNRCKSSCFIRIELFKKPGTLTNLSFFYHQYDSIKDSIWDKNQKFLTIDQTHKPYLHASKKLALAAMLGCKEVGTVATGNPCGCPLKNMLGLTAPAITIEVGLAARDDEWVALCKPLAQAIVEFLA